MAVYKIFPEKDTFLSSEPTIANLYRNAGKDPVIELAGYPDLNYVGRTHRILTQFSTTDINSALDLANPAVTCSLKLYTANASELPTEYTIQAYPISSSWIAGNSMLADEPVMATGATWIKRDLDNSWTNPGGDYLNEYSASTTYNNPDNTDVSLDVTSFINAISSSTIDNNGLLIKFEDTYENYTSQSINLSFFGKDSHTIFKPFLEFGWNDFSYSIGSLSTLTTDNAIINTSNLKEHYKNKNTPVKIRLTSRPQFSDSTFVTSSVKTNYVLPQSSYWSVKDSFTGTTIVNYSENTKISADSTGSYFNVYMNSFSPQRYYIFEFKTTIDGSTLYFEDNKPFKVVI